MIGVMEMIIVKEDCVELEWNCRASKVSWPATSHSIYPDPAATCNFGYFKFRDDIHL